MSTDWNWFFSSFCQCSAALIGIIAAFIISRLIGLNEKVNGIISQYEQLLIEKETLIAALSRRRYNIFNIAYMNYVGSIRRQIVDGEFKSLSEPQILKKLYTDHTSLYKDDEGISKKFLDLNQRLRFQKDTGTIPIPANVQKETDEEKERISKLEVDARTLINKFTANKRDLNNFTGTFKPLQVVIVFLMIAFPITVLVPLQFMPMLPNSSPIITINLTSIILYLSSIKFILLFLFFLAIEGILFYFLQINRSYNQTIRDTIAQYPHELFKLETYSPFLKENKLEGLNT
jgi:hypothetical protein